MKALRVCLDLFFCLRWGLVVEKRGGGGKGGGTGRGWWL